MIERWLTSVEGTEGVRITLSYKYDQKLFRCCTRNASMRVLTECLFADDGALLASTRPGAERAVREYQATCGAFGLTASNPKTKHMVVGSLVEEEDREPIAVASEEVCSVDEFPYLGSLIATSGKMDGDADRRIAQ